jgi:hypothetical protein
MIRIRPAALTRHASARDLTRTRGHDETAGIAGFSCAYHISRRAWIFKPEETETFTFSALSKPGRSGRDFGEKPLTGHGLVL